MSGLSGVGGPPGFRSRAFYSEVLGGQVVLEENPCMVKLSNSWVIMPDGRVGVVAQHRAWQR